MLRRLIIVFMALMLLPGMLHARDTRPRIAIVDFDVDDAGLWIGFKPHKREISAALVELFTTALVERGAVRVFERKRLEAIMKEQNLSMSGNVDPATAVKIGKLMGVQYILTGKITRFAYKGKSFDAFFKVGFKFKNKKLEGRLDIRLIRTDTGEVVYVDKGMGSKKFMNLRIATIGGGTDYDETMVNDIFEPIVEQMADKLSKKVQELKIDTPETMVKEGKVIAVKGGYVFINMGSLKGVQAGDIFTVKKKGEVLIDPDTGEELGAEMTVIGTIKVVEVKEKYSKCKLTSGTAHRGDIVTRD